MLKLNKTKSPVLIREVNKLGKENERLSYVVMPIIKG
jgi:DNA polymerase III sliding clamp (beta) subunit (PCNA family)